MKPLALAEIVDLETYEGLRPRFQQQVIALKRDRRVAVGDRVSLVFENRETLRFQVQEMLRVERIRAPERVQHELDVYNQLMPGPRELSATLFVEITELGRIRHELDRLVGIDEHVSLQLGAGARSEAIPADFDPKQLEQDRISAVQYIRFRFDEAQLARFLDPEVPARICIDHPSYRAEAPLTGATRASLIADLRRDPEPLIGR